MNVAEWIEHATERLAGAELHFGHGTGSARDEAAWLVLQAAGHPVDGSFNDWGREVTAEDGQRIGELLAARCESRQPLAYLLGSAWFAGLEFEVSADVLVPRSPIAELIEDGFRPWADADEIDCMLDMCTGSGCIAIASAVHWPGIRADGADISAAALQVARRNAVRHGVGDRLRWYQSDLFAALPGRRYDLIVANPPYVPDRSLAALPDEYRAEPGLGLASGPDGLDATLEILVDSVAFLGEDGVLICEVGESEQRLAQALPGVPFLWLEFERGGSGVFVLTRPQLEAARPAVLQLKESR